LRPVLAFTVFKRKLTQMPFHVFHANQVVLNLQPVQPILESAQAKALLNTRALHQPMPVDETRIGTFPWRKRLPSGKHDVNRRFSIRLEFNAVDCEAFPGGKVQGCRGSQDVGKDPKGGRQWSGEVLELFVEGGCFPLFFP